MKNKSKEKNKLSSQQAITLIALVVTIVVLLILAGVSLNLVLGNNGIINKAQEAKVETRAAAVDDEVNLWKTDNYLADNTNSASEKEEEMIARLRENKLITEDDEVDTENKVIKIKKKDGTVVREISYEYEKVSNVKINIRKTPETGDTTSVALQVTSVEGLTNISKQDIANMNEEEKKEWIRKTEIMYCNKEEGTNFTTFEQVLQYQSEQGWISNNTEEAFWKHVGEDLEGWLYKNLDYSELPYDEEIKTYTMCQVTNPEGEIADEYIAIENGTYTFTVKDILTDKTYTETVTVNNIIQSDYFVTGNEDGYIAYLINKQNKQETTFEKAYIIYKNEKIDISSLAKNSEYNNIEYSYLYYPTIANYLRNIGKIASNGELRDTIQMFIIEKNDIEYIGSVKMENVYNPPV